MLKITFFHTLYNRLSEAYTTEVEFVQENNKLYCKFASMGQDRCIKAEHIRVIEKREDPDWSK